MSRLSSETLFHYVREKSFLISILQNNFRPRYVKEEFSFESNELAKIALPMLCFCDIKLSSIDEHVKWYGKYGIGMKKEWALKKGLTPVHYYNPNSHAIKHLSDALLNIRQGIKNGTSNLDAYISNYYNLWFLKPYTGEQYNRSEDKILQKEFYDEREWRYIPSLDELKRLDEGLPMSISGDELVRFENKYDSYNSDLNTKLGESISLDFTPQDISYIIVGHEEERLEMIGAIKQAKSHFDRDTRELVFSKIISLEQIFKDF
ncbi:abortive infection system antitoxin AbiGi family protein [Paenibacillus roseipurpureus]|uniref:Abortive infection system antitoxin AbiGi family protein n=1 Tax=Paenibacillus roseopurpureus TaxID=2918901 RepID=A0AA96RN21_9BACL|nr:abortive infection system antitoxin AbiGi family protein [Paenibacillus sp. MBLB1832]WNR46864.1 abortive infection system antitoxin AbiGi family protein [Paenibacillus sp. MBLB1832]